MNWLERQIFKLKLFFNFLPFIGAVLLEKFRRRKSLSVSLALLLIVLAILVINGWRLLHYSQVNQLQAVPEPNFVSQPAKRLTRQEIEEQIKQNQQLLKKQPTHVDLLINTGLLYQALDQEQRAEEYFAQAQQLDPNHSYFEN